jgi:hypothetical protein
MDVAKNVRGKPARSLNESEARFSEQRAVASELPQQLVDVEGVALTALIRGSKARPTVWVEDTYELDIPDHMLEQLTADGGRELLLRALERALPVCCIAVVDGSGQKLFELRQLFFPKSTRDALAPVETTPPISQRVAR